jgi:hypothetical protein
MGLIEKPTIVTAAGNLPKRIEEFVGGVNTGTAALSIARMVSPGGWQEPGQTPEFVSTRLCCAAWCGSKPAAA